MAMRSIFLVFGFLIAQSVHAQCPLNLDEPAVPVTDNLLLYFPFDGTLDNLGDPTYSATLSGATYTGTTCGEGLSFDGDDDYVLVSPNMVLNDDYTVTAWVTPNDSDDPMGIFSIRDQCTTTYRGYSKVQFGMGEYGVAPLSNQINKHIACTGWSGGDRYTNPGIIIPDLEATFVALTVENNNTEGRIVKLYINCVEYETEMTLDMTSFESFDPTIAYLTTIGASSSIAGYTNTFDGVVDEVRVYEDVLTHQEILDIYHTCALLDMEVERFPNCVNDSAEVILHNTEIDVEYQLFDITNGIYIDVPQAGDCGDLIFNTDLQTELTDYRIVATHTVSGCEVNLDSIISIEPEGGPLTEDIAISICEGDSVLVDETYIFDEGIYIDTISFDDACDSIITYTITEFTADDVNFSVTDSVGCYPLTIDFEDETDLPGGIASWDWDFGDGGTSTLENPDHAYAGPGPYDVTLTITSAEGCILDTTMRIIYPNILYFSDTESHLLCAEESVLIDGTLITDAGVYVDTISIGDYCDSIITHTVIIIDDLTVDFSYSDPNGCAPITVDFTDLTMTLSGGEGWFWTFGDGSLSYDQNPSHTYLDGGTYVVTLSVTSAGGCDYEITKTVIVDAMPQPIAAFSFDPPSPEIGDLIQFTDESINATAWLWTFGDGHISTNQNPSHAYSSIGSYNVQVVVTNGECTDTITKVIFIAEEIIFYVPNTFTPDGDSFNDEFLPVFTSGYDPYDYHLKILNRWGEVIFESYNAAYGWNGTYGGKLVQDGVYIWEIEFGDANNDQKHTHTGHINVLK
ncbi:MAG: gliding motility-associated-like protein [Crocinitomix sp.]|jgi:gliding motility-associated-like protein